MPMKSSVSSILRKNLFFIFLLTISFTTNYGNVSSQKKGKDLNLQESCTTKILVPETTNSFAGNWSCANDKYLYGTSSSNLRVILRKSENGQAVETRGSLTTLDPTFSYEYKMFSTSTPGLIFILVKNGDGAYFLLKTADGAATFKVVYAFGQGNGPGGSNAIDVRCLRGFLELTRDIPSGGGKGTLYMGEYNVNHSRSAGSVNDRVRLMRSDDQGDTWKTVAEWNTNGVNQVGHIHAMRQDPYTGEIYVCTGDGQYKLGIIKWDGSASWQNNRTLPQIALMTGFKVLTGNQRYRTCDVLFDQNYFYAFADTQLPNNPDGSESGIWRGTKDFSSYTRVNNHVFDYDPMHIGWFGEKIGNTFIFTTSREYEPPRDKWRELNTEVYTSTDGVNWYASGVLNWRDFGVDTIMKYINNVFSYNNRFYANCVGGAGHYSTIQCEIKGEWNICDDPVILHPVFYSGTWNAPGNDANSGTNPDAPKATLNNLLTSNRISAGSRIRVSHGTFQERGIVPQWSNSYIQGRGSVVIEGQGMDTTFIVTSSSGSNNVSLQVESAKTLSGINSPLILKNLSIYNMLDGGSNHQNYVIQNLDSWVKTSDCRIGNIVNDDSPLIRLDGAGTGYLSENSIHISNNTQSIYKSVVDAGGQNTVISLKNCLILDQYDAFTVNFPGSKLSIKNCTFYNIERYGVVFNIASDVQPEIYNTIFSCGIAPLYDISGIAETKIDYNFYNKPNINVNSGSNSQLGEPSFVDPAARNFNLKNDSPCGMAGLSIPEILFDIKGRVRWNPPSIGAYESPAFFIDPKSVTIDLNAGAAGEFNVRSNTNWKVSGDQDWLSLSPLTGTGNGKIRVTSTSMNTSADPRKSTVTFTSSVMSPVVVSVTQSGAIPTKAGKLQDSEFRIYPNPVSGVLNIEYGKTLFTSLRIINSQGRILSKIKITGSIQNLDFSGFEKGIYILEFRDPAGFSKKVKVINH